MPVGGATRVPVGGGMGPRRGNLMTTQDDRPGTTSAARIAASIQLGANVAVIVTCAIVGWVALHRTQPTPQALAPTYAIGDRVGPINGVDFAGSQQTLLMVLREDCQYCEASVPFYQKLTAELTSKAGRKVRVVVASTDAPSALSAYLKANDILVDQVAEVQPGALKVPGTPFLMLVDAKGAVTQLWRGKLRVKQEQEVISLLTAG
jgi:hypothetical protein